MKLADRNMMHHIYPITLLEQIDEIMIVRDTKGPEINKVQYICPPKWTLNVPIIALLYKFGLMLYLSIHEKPELVHGYLLFPHGVLAIVVGMLTSKKTGVSLIAGPVELYAPGRSPIGEYPYCKPLPYLNRTGTILLYLLNKCDAITVTGNYTKSFLLNNGIDGDKISVLPHAIDGRFKVMDIDKEYDVVFVGRLAAIKHIETLIQSIDVVRKKCPNVKVVIVGDGECKTELDNLSKKLNLSKIIYFAGYQSDVWEWYNKGKLSVITSEREGFPYSVVESLSCGLPVIISNCGDVFDIIKNNYNGIIVNDYQDYYSFAEAILKLLQNPEIIGTQSMNALASANNMNNVNVAAVWGHIISNK